MRQDFCPGKVIANRFELMRPLGEGGLGAVWLAADRRNPPTEVAIKLFDPQTFQSGDALDRFAREGMISAALDHPCVAQALDWNVSGEQAYIAMEHVDGQTLAAELAARAETHERYDYEAFLRIAYQLSATLDYAHSLGIVHRDLKPTNVMVQRRAGIVYVKVLDFGVAKIALGDESLATTFGRSIGTPMYMSPEQTIGAELDHRADIFALGTLLFELLTLRKAWARDKDGRPCLAMDGAVAGGNINSYFAIATRIVSEPRPKLTELCPHLPGELNAIFAKAMAIDPNDRFGSTQELWDALQAVAATNVDETADGAGAGSTRVRAVEEDEDATLVDSSDPVVAELSSARTTPPVSRSKPSDVRRAVPWTWIAIVLAFATLFVIVANRG